MKMRKTVFVSVAAAAAIFSSSALATTCTDLMEKYASENAKSPVVYRSVLQGKRGLIYRDMTLKARKMDAAGDSKGCVETVNAMQARIKADVEKDKGVNKGAWSNAAKNRIGNGVSISQFRQSDLSKDKFVGKTAYDADGQPVGMVDHYVVVGEDRYVLVSPTRFMGGSDEYRVVPISMIRIVKDDGSVLIPLKAKQFSTMKTVPTPDFLTTAARCVAVRPRRPLLPRRSVCGRRPRRRRTVRR